MRDENLPTAQEILDRAATYLDTARVALSEAGNWLRSDWQPVGSPLTKRQSARRTRMSKAVAEAKVIIDKSERWR